MTHEEATRRRIGMRIYLDMDGVLCDFVGATCRLFGQDESTVKQWNYFEDWGYDENKFWARIDEWETPFWANLEPYWWTSDLLEVVSKLDPDFRICTTPSRSHHSYAGKVRWLQKHIEMPHKRLVMLRDKSQLSKPGRLLIDDNQATYELWEEAGGDALLWPQPWNNAQVTVHQALDVLENTWRTLSPQTLGA